MRPQQRRQANGRARAPCVTEHRQLSSTTTAPSTLQNPEAPEFVTAGEHRRRCYILGYLNAQMDALLSDRGRCSVIGGFPKKSRANSSTVGRKARLVATKRRPKLTPEQRKLVTENFTEQDREWVNSFIDKGVGPKGCWIWRGYRMPNGYGAVSVLGRSHTAHRVVFVMEGGHIPEGLQLDHLCQRRACVNPAHLEPVTNAENSRRRLFVKLDPDKVREIRALRAGGMLQKDIAARFNMSEKQISRVIRHEVWADIPSDTPPVTQRRLTAEQVREIRALPAGGMEAKEIAPRYGISVSQVWRIVQRRNWAEVADLPAQAAG
jgi:transposase